MKFFWGENEGLEEEPPLAVMIDIYCFLFVFFFLLVLGPCKIDITFSQGRIKVMQFASRGFIRTCFKP